MSEELRPCPFCGWQKIHMRKKTQMRESVTGFTYMRGYDQFDPVSLGYTGQEFREVHCYDYRFGIRFYCGKCKVETPYVWGEWHLPTEDEAETFDDMPHACERFDPDEEQVTIDKAIAIWNRRHFNSWALSGDVLYFGDTEQSVFKRHLLCRNGDFQEGNE